MAAFSLLHIIVGFWQREIIWEFAFSGGKRNAGNKAYDWDVMPKADFFVDVATLKNWISLQAGSLFSNTS